MAEPQHPRGRRAAVSSVTSLGALLIVASSPAILRAQTDYYNTDRNRPIRIEDAYATERYAFDAHLAPLRLEHSPRGVYTWGIDPEIAYGLAPRTQLEVGLPIALIDRGTSGRSTGLSGVDVSLLYNLNAETSSLPALGVRTSVLVPAGSLAPDRAYPSVKGILTRTYRWARVHLNGEYTFGTSPDAQTAAGIGAGAVEVSRWLGGVALDRTFPLRALLLTGEVYARQPLHEAEDVEWNAAAGLRYQIDPLLAFDAGIGRRLSGDVQPWYITFGIARVFALRGLLPGR